MYLDMLMKVNILLLYVHLNESINWLLLLALLILKKFSKEDQQYIVPFINLLKYLFLQIRLAETQFQMTSSYE